MIWNSGLEQYTSKLITEKKGYKMITLLTLLLACSDTYTDGEWFDEGEFDGEISRESAPSALEVLSSGKRANIVVKTQAFFAVSDQEFCSKVEMQVDITSMEVTLECEINDETINNDTWDFACEMASVKCSGNGYERHWDDICANTVPAMDIEYDWNDEPCPIDMVQFAGTGFKDGFYISGEGEYVFSEYVGKDFSFYFGN